MLTPPTQIFAQSLRVIRKLSSRVSNQVKTGLLAQSATPHCLLESGLIIVSSRPSIEGSDHYLGASKWPSLGDGLGGHGPRGRARGHHYHIFPALQREVRVWGQRPSPDRYSGGTGVRAEPFSSASLSLHPGPVDAGRSSGG